MDRFFSFLSRNKSVFSLKNPSRTGKTDDFCSPVLKLFCFEACLPFSAGEKVNQMKQMDNPDKKVKLFFVIISQLFDFVKCM